MNAAQYKPWMKKSGWKDKVPKRRTELSKLERLDPSTDAPRLLVSLGQPSRATRPTSCCCFEVLRDATADHQTLVLACLLCPCFHLAQTYSPVPVASSDSCCGAGALLPQYQSTQTQPASKWNASSIQMVLNMK